MSAVRSRSPSRVASTRAVVSMAIERATAIATCAPMAAETSRESVSGRQASAPIDLIPSISDVEW